MKLSLNFLDKMDYAILDIGYETVELRIFTEGKYETELSYPRSSGTGNSAADPGDAADEGAETKTTVTLHGQIAMPPYSVQYFHQI